MTSLSNTFGIAARNFTAYPQLPDAKGLLDYGVKVEQLGYDSLWVWDHILLGVDPHFPILDSLTTLTAIAARTTKLKLGTGILVLPLRNPVALAKQLSSIDQFSNGRLIMGMASGWYKREFDAMGIPFDKRGKLMDENLEILNRLWTEPMVNGKYTAHNISAAVMYPKPVQKPRIPLLIGGYVDRVLKRAGTVGDGWLTYFYTPESFTRGWEKVKAFAREAGRDPGKLTATNQLAVYVGRSRQETTADMRQWLSTEWDTAAWSESTIDHAVHGSASECVEQLRAHVRTGVHRIILIPYRYQAELVERIAKEVLPKL